MYNFRRIMVIAAYTKATLSEHPARKRILDALVSRGDFDIIEIQGNLPIPTQAERMLVDLARMYFSTVENIGYAIIEL